ncbi:MAG: RhoGEF domain-containing protein, partial [Candidatus Berkiella sp.]
LEVLKTKPPNEWGDVLNKMSDMYAQYAVVYNRLLEKQPPPGVNINPDLEMTLDQYLIMPVQRTPRYKLLSDDLLKNLPQDHPNRNGISQFNKMSIDVAKKMNSRVEVFEICRDLTALSKERQNSIKNAKNMKTDVKTKLQLEIEVIEAVAKHMKDKTDEKGFTDAVIEAYEEFNKNNKGPQFIEQFTKLGSTWRELERKHQFKFSHDDTSRALMTHVGEEIVTKRRASVSDVPPPPRETTLRERSSSAPNLSVGTVEPQTDITTAPPSPILHQAQRAHTEREVMLEQKTNKAPITIQEIHSTLQAQNVQNISKYVTAGSTFTKVAPDSTQFDTIGVGIEVPDRKTAQYYIQTKENSVNYSLNKDLSQNDKTAALAKICEAVVATLTSDHVINLEGKSNKEETHQALHNALVKKYGEDYANNPQAPKVVGVERTPSRVQAHSLNN